MDASKVTSRLESLLDNNLLRVLSIRRSIDAAAQAPPSLPGAHRDAARAAHGRARGRGGARVVAVRGRCRGGAAAAVGGAPHRVVVASLAVRGRAGRRPRAALAVPPLQQPDGAAARPRRGGALRSPSELNAAVGPRSFCVT